MAMLNNQMVSTCVCFVRVIFFAISSDRLQIIDILHAASQDIVALPLMVFQEVDGPFMDAFGIIGLLYWTMNVVNTPPGGAIWRHCWGLFCAAK